MPAGIFARMSGRFAKSDRLDGTSDRSALSHGCRGNHPARKGNASLRPAMAKGAEGQPRYQIDRVAIAGVSDPARDTVEPSPPSGREARGKRIMEDR